MKDCFNTDGLMKLRLMDDAMALESWSHIIKKHKANVTPLAAAEVHNVAERNLKDLIQLIYSLASS